MSSTIDYSLYLVTGRELLPQGKNYLESLEESLKGGVTVVQVREKTVDTGEFLQIARQTKEICDKYKVPIIINDRVDVALAIGADGVHLGQTDMPLPTARQLLPKGTIIGVSVNNPEEAKRARDEGADYVGIGAVYPTESKKLTNPVLGVRDVGPILEVLEGTNIRAVAIGGINGNNVLRTLHGAVSPVEGRRLQGVAVISDIVASQNPFAAAKKLSTLIQAFQNSTLTTFSSLAVPAGYSPYGIAEHVCKLLTTIRDSTPLVHQITNNVVMNQSANATLALGASPIMATKAEEMEDLSRVCGSLLVNIGTIGDKEGMLVAGRWANINRKPVVLDPVAVGATNLRRTTARDLLNAWQATVIKGNAGEIGALAGSAEVRSRGVDSVGAGFADPATVVRNLARRERCIIVMTGPHDYISDGNTVVRVSNGHPVLGHITGSGCMTGTCIATFCAAASILDGQNEGQPEDGRLVRGDMLLGAVGGILAITIASELATAREDVEGSGTFLPALIDELGKLDTETILDRARLEIL